MFARVNKGCVAAVVWLLCDFRPETQQTLINQSICHMCGERRAASLSAGKIGIHLGSHGDVLLIYSHAGAAQLPWPEIPFAGFAAELRVHDKNVLFIRPLVVMSYYTNGSSCLEFDFKWHGSHILMKMRKTCFAIRNKRFHVLQFCNLLYSRHSCRGCDNSQS